MARLARLRVASQSDITSSGILCLPLGHGHQIFAGAGDALHQWQMQLRAGLQVAASSATAEAGAVLIPGLGRFTATPGAVPCRVRRR